jgi:ABC-type Fe3+ transport system permease subunit
MKPFTTIAIAVFALIAVMHILRLVLSWEITVNTVIIPMWVSVLGLIIAAGLAWLLWLENKRPPAA